MSFGSFLMWFKIAICVPLSVLASSATTTTTSSASTDHFSSWQPRGVDSLTTPEERMIADFLKDVASIETIQTNSTILTPCYKISRDSSFTRSWTHEDWLQREWEGKKIDIISIFARVCYFLRLFFPLSLTIVFDCCVTTNLNLSRFCTTYIPLLASSQ